MKDKSILWISLMAGVFWLFAGSAQLRQATVNAVRDFWQHVLSFL
jgi:hypothetical protein